EARKVGSLPRVLLALRSPQDAGEYVEEPSEEEYLEALAAGLARTPDQELTLRRLAWWRGNDAFRSADPSETCPPASEKRKENLLALARLLDGSDDNSLLTKAEVLRHLGAFKAALEVLARVTGAEYPEVVVRFRELCAAGDPCVRRL